LNTKIKILTATSLALVILFSSCKPHSHSTARQKLSDEAGHPYLAYGEVYYRLLKDTNATVSTALRQITGDSVAVTNITCPIHLTQYVFNMETAKWRDREHYAKEVALFCPEVHHGFYLGKRLYGGYVVTKEKPKL
jgi:hypothetical protein